MAADTFYKKLDSDGVSKISISRSFKHSLRRYIYLAAFVVLGFLCYRWLTRSSTERPSDLRMGYRGEVFGRPSMSSQPGNVLRLEVFMEAQCPDTSRFVHKQLMPAWRQLSGTGRVDWTIVPFGKARCQEKPDGDFECSCQHGPNECILNQLMNCVIERVGHPDRFMETLECIQGLPNLDSALEKCIAPNPQFSLTQMQQCASSSHGRRLLALAGAKTAGLSPRLTFVPWIMIEGERVVDALYALPENLCKRLEPAPIACSGN